MNHLTRADYAGALALLARLEPAAADLPAFAHRAIALVTDYVASELTTLSVCDLVTGHRRVVGLPGVRLGAQELAAFDRHFFEHPLVRHHGLMGGRTSHRISDALSRPDFRATALYADYYRRIGLEHAVAVPLYSDGRTLVSLVLNRRGLDFSERDRERLELLRPHLAFLYRLAAGAGAGEPVGGEPAAGGPVPDAIAVERSPGAVAAGPERAGTQAASILTPREHEVMHWLARGKTDADIAALLSVSKRTVHKHLEHIYVKLGVETRTAAVMRALTAQWPDGRRLAGPVWRAMGRGADTA